MRKIPQERTGGPTDRVVERIRRVVNAMEDSIPQVVEFFDVELPNATVVRLSHGIGSRTTRVFVGAPLDAAATGRVSVVSADTDDLAVALRADGFGGTITVPYVMVRA